MPSPTAPPTFRTRTDVLFASRAPVAVVLRRGPRTHFQLVLWDTRRDVFTPGQWIKGLVKLMDLSPGGDKLIYWAAQYHSSARWLRPRETDAELGPYDPLTSTKHVMRRMQARHPKRKLPRYLTGVAPGLPAAREVQGVWTAVSTPPYFSALAIWPSIGHWTGGGFFATEKRIVLFEGDCGLTPIENVRIPSTIRVSPWDAVTALLPPPPTLAHNPLRQPTEQQIEIELALKDAGARFVDWVHVAAGGDILFACDGCIHRHPGVPARIGPDILRGARRLIDLSANRFELIRAPNAAMRW